MRHTCESARTLKIAIPRFARLRNITDPRAHNHDRPFWDQFINHLFNIMEPSSLQKYVEVPNLRQLDIRRWRASHASPECGTTPHEKV